MDFEQHSAFNVLNNSSVAAPAQSCGSACGCTTDDAEFEQRLLQLRSELDVKPSSTAIRREIDQPDRDAKRYRFSLSDPLPLVKEISRRRIETKHLWVGVKEAAVAVFNDDEARIADQLLNGAKPGSISFPGGDASEGLPLIPWHNVAAVVSRLAQSGFIAGIKGYVEDRPSSPDRFARFHLTKACQLECVHCYADSSPRVSRAGELTTDRWKQLAVEFVANGGENILFTGGEALLHAGCLEVMQAVRDAGAETTLFTNGLLVPRYAKEIHLLASSVQVSLDGPDAPSNDLVRGVNTYKHIIRAIDTLVAQGTKTRIGMSVMLANWDAWKTNFLAFAERYRGTSVEFKLSFGLTHYGRARDLAPIPVEEVQPIAFSFMEGVNGSTGPKITRTVKGCGYCEQLVVGPDGLVYPCHLLDAQICHVDDHPMPELINVLRRFGRLFDVDQVEGCNTCDIRYLCGGTCRVINRQQTGSRFATTCDHQEKERKVRNLLRTYSN